MSTVSKTANILFYYQYTCEHRQNTVSQTTDVSMVKDVAGFYGKHITSGQLVCKAENECFLFFPHMSVQVEILGF